MDKVKAHFVGETPSKSSSVNRYNYSLCGYNLETDYIIYIGLWLWYNAVSEMEKNTKQATIEAYRLHEEDTGSPEVQVALLTERINRLTDHMRANSHDFHSLRGLLMLVGQRQRHLKYLTRIDPERYRSVIARLGIRK